MWKCWPKHFPITENYFCSARLCVAGITAHCSHKVRSVEPSFRIFWQEIPSQSWKISSENVTESFCLKTFLWQEKKNRTLAHSENISIHIVYLFCAFLVSAKIWLKSQTTILLIQESPHFLSWYTTCSISFRFQLAEYHIGCILIKMVHCVLELFL